MLPSVSKVTLWSIHSKSKKICGTAFSVKKIAEKCVNPGVIFRPFGVIFGPFLAIFIFFAGLLESRDSLLECMHPHCSSLLRLSKGRATGKYAFSKSNVLPNSVVYVGSPKPSMSSKRSTGKNIYIWNPIECKVIVCKVSPWLEWHLVAPCQGHDPQNLALLEARFVNWLIGFSIIATWRDIFTKIMALCFCFCSTIMSGIEVTKITFYTES